MTNSLTLLEKVAGIRQVLTVAKALQEKRPTASTLDIVDAITAVVYSKYDKLNSKPFTTLTAAQVVTLAALKTAKMVMRDVLDILGADDTRSLNEDEIAAMTENNTVMAAKRKAAAAKRAAEKAKAEAPDTKKSGGQLTLASA